MADADTDGIERLLEELEGDLGDGAAGRTPLSKAKPPTVSADVDRVAAASAVEYNPYSNTAEQQSLQNLAPASVLAAAATTTASKRDTSSQAFAQPSLIARPQRLPSLNSPAARPHAPVVGGPNPSIPPMLPSAPVPLRQPPNLSAEELRILTGKPAASEPPQSAPGSNTKSSPGADRSPSASVHAVLEAHLVKAAPGSIPPSSRVDHSLTVLGGSRLILFGGTPAGANAPVNDCYEFDLATNGWEPVVAARGDPPAPRSAHVAVAIDLDGCGLTTMLVHGGRSAAGDALEDMLTLDGATQSWAPLHTEGKAIGARLGHSAVSIGPKVYFFGGKVQKHDAEKGTTWVLGSDMHVLDTATCHVHRYTGRTTGSTSAHHGSSDQQAAAGGSDVVVANRHPPKRYGHAACAASNGRSVFIHGGVTSGSTALADLWRFDVKHRHWSEVMLHGSVPRTRHAMLSVPGTLVLVGGVVSTASASGAAGQRALKSGASISVIAEGPALEGGAGTTECIPRTAVGPAPLAPLRVGSACAAVDGVLYVHGGYSPADDTATLRGLTAVSLSIASHAECSSVAGGAALDATRLALHADGCPFDVALDTGDGPLLGAHRSLLSAVAPGLLSVLKEVAAAGSGGAGPVEPAVLRRGRFALHTMVCPLTARSSSTLLKGFSPTRTNTERLLRFLYTGKLFLPSDEPVSSDTAVDLLTTALRPAADAFELGTLRAAVDRVLSGSTNVSPSKHSGDDQSPDRSHFSRNRLAAELSAAQRLSETVEHFDGDALSSDVMLTFAEAAAPHADGRGVADEGIPLHAFVLTRQSQVFRRIVQGLLLQQPPGNSMASLASPSTIVTYTDRDTGIKASLVPSFMSTDPKFDRRIVLASPTADENHGRPVLPATKSSLAAVQRYLYTGRADMVHEDNALEVLTAAKVLSLVGLATAAQRAIVEHVEVAALRGEVRSPSEICALLLIGDQRRAEHVVSRVAVAAAEQFADVQREPAFRDLPSLVQDYVSNIAAQLGNR